MKYRVIYEYDFYRGSSATETARRVYDVYGGHVAKEKTVRLCVTKFPVQKRYNQL